MNDFSHDIQNDRDEEIFALDPTGRHGVPELAGVVYDDGQDPSEVSQAGLVALYHVKLLERLYVGERMAAMVFRVRRKLEGRLRALVPGEITPNTESVVRHEAAAEFILSAIHPMPAKACFRGPEALDRIACHVLLRRAKVRLAHNPADTEADAIAQEVRRHLRRPQRQPNGRERA